MLVLTKDDIPTNKNVKYPNYQWETSVDQLNTIAGQILLNNKYYQKGHINVHKCK